MKGLEYGELMEWYWKGKVKVLARKSVLLSPCPPQLPHRLALEWARTSSLSIRRGSFRKVVVTKAGTMERAQYICQFRNMTSSLFNKPALSNTRFVERHVVLRRFVCGPREFLKKINLYSDIRMEETCDSMHFAGLIKSANRCLIFDGN